MKNESQEALNQVERARNAQVIKDLKISLGEIGEGEDDVKLRMTIDEQRSLVTKYLKPTTDATEGAEGIEVGLASIAVISVQEYVDSDEDFKKRHESSSRLFDSIIDKMHPDGAPSGNELLSQLKPKSSLGKHNIGIAKAYLQTIYKEKPTGENRDIDGYQNLMENYLKMTSDYLWIMVVESSEEEDIDKKSLVDQDISSMTLIVYEMRSLKEQFETEKLAMEDEDEKAPKQVDLQKVGEELDFRIDVAEARFKAVQGELMKKIEGRELDRFMSMKKIEDQKLDRFMMVASVIMDLTDKTFTKDENAIGFLNRRIKKRTAEASQRSGKARERIEKQIKADEITVQTLEQFEKNPIDNDPNFLSWKIDNDKREMQAARKTADEIFSGSESEIGSELSLEEVRKMFLDENITNVEGMKAVMSEEAKKAILKHILARVDNRIAAAKRLVSGGSSRLGLRSVGNVMGLNSGSTRILRFPASVAEGRILDGKVITQMPIKDYIEKYFGYDLTKDEKRSEDLSHYSDMFS